jgi:hypothetical protein
MSDADLAWSATSEPWRAATLGLDGVAASIPAMRHVTLHAAAASAPSFPRSRLNPAYLTDRDRHRERNRVKRLGNRFKQHRRIATRHEKRVNAYTSFRALVAIRMWL